MIPVINLDSAQGNAFYLIGIASKEAPHIVEEMQAGDYDNLLTVFCRELGDNYLITSSDPHLMAIVDG